MCIDIIYFGPPLPIYRGLGFRISLRSKCILFGAHGAPGQPQCPKLVKPTPHSPQPKAAEPHALKPKPECSFCFPAASEDAHSSEKDKLLLMLRVSIFCSAAGLSPQNVCELTSGLGLRRERGTLQP